MRAQVVVALLLVMAGCRWGTPFSKFGPAHGPAGAQVRVLVGVPGERTERWSGELIEVRDSALVAHFEPNLVLVPYWTVREIRVAGSQIVARGAPNAATIERMRPVSRYPYGLSPERLEALLRAYGQTSLHVLGR